jgi:hypothetical protein
MASREDVRHGARSAAASGEPAPLKHEEAQEGLLVRSAGDSCIAAAQDAPSWCASCRRRDYRTGAEAPSVCARISRSRSAAAFAAARMSSPFTAAVIA